MDHEGKSASSSSPADSSPGKPGAQSIDDFFNRLQSDMKRPDLSQEAITEAFHAIQRLALDTDTEDSVTATQAGAGNCHVCGAPNSAANRFCGACGVPLPESPSPTAAAEPSRVSGAAPGQHNYHHHYHHHYFSSVGGPSSQAAPAPASGAPLHDNTKTRTAPSGSPMSRAEIAVRKMTQDWALACNTKHLDDLVDLYTADAVVLRSNVSPIRGAAAIREYFFALLDAGLGDVEFEPLRVEMFGDVAYEAGRCKMLAPMAMGKRREERGKYQLVFIRVDGEWKITGDCWSSDLSLGLGVDVPSKPPLQRPPQK